MSAPVTHLAHRELKVEIFDYKHVGGRLLAIGLAGFLILAGVLVWGSFEPRQFAFSYLLGFAFFFTICAGGLFWTLVHHAVDAEWSVVVRRQTENLASLLGVLAILFVPLIFVREELWVWMRPEAANDPLLKAKWPYLTPEFFWARALFYFGFFTLAGSLLKNFSVSQDKDGSAKWTVLNRRVTFISLPIFALSLTFSGIDWLMGLDYHWYSTMWGVYLFAGAALSSMCVLVLIVTALRSVGYFRDVVTVEHYHIMGKLMLSFTIFWAYIAFSQYMLIWYANIPEETIYFLLRTTESWWYMSLALVAGHFFIPFLLLLPQPGKRNPTYLCWVAVWILIMHFVDLYVVVLPVLHTTGVVMSALDLLCPLAIGFILTAVFLKRLGDTPLFPVRDPRLDLSIHLKN